MIQVVEGHDEPDVVLVDEAGQRVHVAGSAIRGTIAWRSEWKRAGASGSASAPTTTAPAARNARTMSTRCPRAGEEHHAHERRGYSSARGRLEEFATAPLT